MIELADYFMGHERRFGHLLGTDLRANAGRTVEAANALLVLAKLAGVALHRSPSTGTIVVSGWRPSEVNEATPGASPLSRHISCQAIDLYDPAGDLDEWLFSVAEPVLHDLGAWLEHPSTTKGWVHLQIVPPRSGRRVFYP